MEVRHLEAGLARSGDDLRSLEVSRKLDAPDADAEIPFARAPGRGAGGRIRGGEHVEACRVDRAGTTGRAEQQQCDKTVHPDHFGTRPFPNTTELGFRSR